MRRFRPTLLCLLMLSTFAVAPVPPAVGQADPVCLFAGRCGDVNASGKVTAADALAVLRDAVGTGPGLLCTCSDDPATEVLFEVDPVIILTNTSYQLRASFPHIADQGANWRLLSDPAAGTLTEDGLYTAGAETGEDLAEVASLVSPATRRNLDVRVLGPDKLVYYWTNMNGDAVADGGAAPQIVVPAPMTTASLTTYHHNGGEGVTPGTLGLKRIEDDKTFGPWPAFGLPGVDPFPNLFWSVNLGGLVLEPGTYQVLDSDPSTWSSNGTSAGYGMTEIMGWNLE